MNAQSLALVRAIGDAKLRSSVMSILENPAPRYMDKYPTQASRVALRDSLAREGFVNANAPIEGIFPPVSDTGVAQPFWSAPGSETNGHHGYPGGLCAHELFNGRVGLQLAQTYDRHYFHSRNAVNQDVSIAAAFYHDIMKTVVFQYCDDGTISDEIAIAGTGAHHCLSAAEAIVRGHDARFVTVLLSAHAAPSLGDERHVVAWCRAAAVIAGVNPLDYGILRKSMGEYVLAERPPIEAFVNHLSDHDYVFSIHAASEVRTMLASMAPRFGIDASNVSALNWWQLEVCSRVSDMALYHELTKGEDAFVNAVRAAVS